MKDEVLMGFIGNYVIDDIGSVELSLLPNASQFVVVDAINTRTCRMEKMEL